MHLDARELQAWLILLRAPELGPAALRALMRRHGSAVAALAFARSAHARTAASTRAWLRRPEPAQLAGDLAWLAQPGCHLLTCADADFPSLLNEIPAPPAALFVRGDPALLWRAQVAIVGSRSATQAGLATAAAFARALAGAGLAITSGLADGIDGAAHAAALDSGGTTLAVLGTGADRVYPRRHRALAERVAAEGVLVSEFPLTTAPRADHFPRRNRLIAGLSLGTLVIEAGLRSGSLITAACAADAGREVFALPGSIHNPLARGCHQLIRNGARLVESADEVLAELAPLAQRLGCALRERLDAPGMEPSRAQSPRPVPPPGGESLLAALGHEALGVDELAERCGLPVASVSSMLLMLELEGAVAAAVGGRYARRL